MKMVELEEVCEIRNGYAFKSEEYRTEGIPLLRISNFNDGDVFTDENTAFVDPQYLTTKSDFIVEHGDILIALSGATTGKYGFYNFNFPSLLNQRIGVLKSGTSTQLFDRYFYHYLNILKSEILRNAGGAAQPNISTKTIGKFLIPLPPLPIQQKIAAILDAADAYRQKTKALIEKYDLLAQSLFLEMFGDPVRNEMGWEIVKFDNVSTQITDGEHITPKRELNGYKLLSCRNIKNGYIDFGAGVDFVGDSEFKRITKRCKPERNDILISCSGTIGRVTVVNIDEPFVLVRSVAIIKLKKDLALPIYIEHYLRTPFMQHTMMINANTSSQSNLFTGPIKNLPISLPPLSLQTLFANRIALIDQQKQQAQQSFEKAEALFNSLLQRAFKGELVS